MSNQKCYKNHKFSIMELIFVKMKNLDIKYFFLQELNEISHKSKSAFYRLNFWRNMLLCLVCNILKIIHQGFKTN